MAQGMTKSILELEGLLLLQRFCITYTKPSEIANFFAQHQ